MHQPVPLPDPLGAGLRRMLGRPTVAITGVMLLAALLRFWSLGHPSERVFDEIHYPKSACLLLGWSAERCGIEDATPLEDGVHPPLGKYTIALGELALGFDASDGLQERDTLSFRLPSAILGTATVGLVALAAWLLFGTPWAAWLAGALLAVEGLSVVHSRVGMLDGLVTFWIMLAVACLLLDKRWGDARARGVAAEARRAVLRPWKIATGVALGAAIATKWSGAMALVPIVAIGLWWDADRQRATGASRWIVDTLLREGPTTVLTFLILPLVLYIGTYSAYLVTPDASLDAFLQGQVANARFHATFEGAPDEAECRAAAESGGLPCVGDITSRPWDWMLLRSSIVYWQDTTPGHRALILATGSPGVFWGGFISIPLAVYLAVRKRDGAAAVIAAMFLALYLPWFAVRRLEFIFYAVPLSPFLVLAFVLLVREANRRVWLTASKGVTIYALLLGVVTWPVYAGIALPDLAWRVLQPFFPTWWNRV